MAFRRFINKDAIISADIIKPYENSGEEYDTTPTHGWVVRFLVGYDNGHPVFQEATLKDIDDCVCLIRSLGLTEI
jgi:hypothetical protein